MAVYAIADTHLSGAVPKSMEKFGRRWTGYTDKIASRWRALVTDADTVVIPGDVSWAMTLPEAAEDFRFLAALPAPRTQAHRQGKSRFLVDNCHKNAEILRGKRHSRH